MSKAKELLSEVGMQMRTKAKEPMNGGSRHIRNTIENGMKGISRMLDPNNGLPSPADSKSAELLKKSASMLSRIRDDIKVVKDTKKKGSSYE